MLKIFAKNWVRAARRLARKQVGQLQTQQKKILKLAASGATQSIRKTSTVKRPAIKKPVLPTMASLGGRWTRHYHQCAQSSGAPGYRRITYWRYVPAGLSEGAAHPLVVMLHGCEQDAPDFAAGTRMNLLADRFGFVVVYPQQSLSRQFGGCWQWYRQDALDGNGEVALIASLVDQLAALPEIDRSRIYVAGMSAGAAMSHLLALRRPDLIAAVALHSCPAFGVADSRLAALALMQTGTRAAMVPIQRLLQQQKDFPAMPTLIIHGDADHVVRPMNAEHLLRQTATLNGIVTDSVAAVVSRPARGKCDAYRLSDYGSGDLAIRLCQIRHLGHAWSGGDPSFRFNIACGPDASRMCWNFFKRQRRNTVAV